MGPLRKWSNPDFAVHRFLLGSTILDECSLALIGNDDFGDALDSILATASPARENPAGPAASASRRGRDLRQAIESALCGVLRVKPVCLQIVPHERPWARRAAILAASIVTWAPPSLRPLAFAFLMPARTRSQMLTQPRPPNVEVRRHPDTLQGDRANHIYGLPTYRQGGEVGIRSLASFAQALSVWRELNQYCLWEGDLNEAARAADAARARQEGDSGADRVIFGS